MQNTDYYSTHLDVALAVDEQVLRLQVPVYEIQVVEVLEGQHYLRRVESGVRLTANHTHTRTAGQSPVHQTVQFPPQEL